MLLIEQKDTARSWHERGIYTAPHEIYTVYTVNLFVNYRTIALGTTSVIMTLRCAHRPRPPLPPLPRLASAPPVPCPPPPPPPNLYTLFRLLQTL